MSPELERLLNALWEVRNCDPRDRTKWQAAADRLIQDALNRTPGMTREQLLEALNPRLQELRRSRRKHSSIPPKA